MQSDMVEPVGVNVLSAWWRQAVAERDAAIARAEQAERRLALLEKLVMRVTKEDEEEDDMLARAEAAEAERDRLREAIDSLGLSVEKINAWYGSVEALGQESEAGK